MVECKHRAARSWDISGTHEYVSASFSNPLAVEKVYLKKSYGKKHK